MIPWRNLLKKHWPTIFAVFAAVAAGLSSVLLCIQPFSKSVSGGGIAVGLIVAGFTATQRNLLLGLDGARILRFAADTGYFEDILRYLRRCVYAGLMLTLVSIIGLFVEEPSSLWHPWLAIWTGTIALVLGFAVQNERLMFELFTDFLKGQSGSS